jgi:hypothetical protein
VACCRENFTAHMWISAHVAGQLIRALDSLVLPGGSW